MATPSDQAAASGGSTATAEQHTPTALSTRARSRWMLDTMLLSFNRFARHTAWR